jgi:N utilization substance protein B
MQALYSHLQNPATDINMITKWLQQSIEQSDKLYLLNLYFCIRVAEYSKDDEQVQASKFLLTDEEKKVNTAIYSNAFVNGFLKEHDYAVFVEKQKPFLQIDDDIIRKIYLELKSAEPYKKFVADNTGSIKEVQAIFNYLYGEIIYKSELFHSLMEELSPGWMDEQTFIHKRIDMAFKTGRIEMADLKQDEAIRFAYELIDKTYYCENELTELIKPKLRNWDADRLAAVDLILIKLALCEILYFENVPIKVSINEYIDISKLYSTPKSKDFVNGIVDKIKNELLRDGKIQKAGRGLIND